MLWRLPKWAYNESVGRLLNKRTQDAEIADLVEEEETPTDADTALNAAKPANANSESRKRKIKTKAR